MLACGADKASTYGKVKRNYKRIVAMTHSFLDSSVKIIEAMKPVIQFKGYDAFSQLYTLAMPKENRDIFKIKKWQLNNLLDRIKKVYEKLEKEGKFSNLLVEIEFARCEELLAKLAAEWRGEDSTKLVFIRQSSNTDEDKPDDKEEKPDEDSAEAVGEGGSIDLTDI